jgi:hypothetical protein
MQPQIIMIYSDNKRLLYSIDTMIGKGTFEAEIKTFEGRKYYSHKGMNYVLPNQFQGKAPICKL